MWHLACSTSIAPILGSWVSHRQDLNTYFSRHSIRSFIDKYNNITSTHWFGKPHQGLSASSNSAYFSVINHTVLRINKSRISPNSTHFQSFKLCKYPKVFKPFKKISLKTYNKPINDQRSIWSGFVLLLACIGPVSFHILKKEWLKLLRIRLSDTKTRG